MTARTQSPRYQLARLMRLTRGIHDATDNLAVVMARDSNLSPYAMELGLLAESLRDKLARFSSLSVQ